MKRLALLALVLLAGCGDEATSDPAPKAAQTDAGIFKTVSNDMRDIAALAAGECANQQAIRRAMGRLEQDAEQLPVTSGGQKASRLVDEVLAETQETLRVCE